MSAPDKLRAYGQLLLGSGLIISGINILRGSGPRTNVASDLGDTQIADPKEAGKLQLVQGKAGKAVGPPKAKGHDVWTIDQRVSYIIKLLKKGSLNAQLHEATKEILSQKTLDGKGGLRWAVPEKDCVAEVKWIYTAIRNPNSKLAVRYTRDMLLADTFSAAERTLFKTHGEDCDGYAILIGAMLMAVGHVVRIRVIQTTDSKTNSWNHVYLITPKKFDSLDGEWMAVDCSVNKPAGWEAPGASEVARTGKPSGIVVKVKDFKVVANG